MPIRFQLIDVDYFINTRNSKAETGPPVIRMYGKTESGRNICVFYDKFLPYFFARGENIPEQVKGIKEIVNITETEKFIPLGYREKPEKMFKITLLNPQDVPAVRDMLLEKKIAEECFESDILFKYRFMVDFGIKGMQWIEADCEKITNDRVKNPAFLAKTIKPLEIRANSQLKYMSFDIECLPSDIRKPLNSKKDPIIIIAIAFHPDYKGSSSYVLLSKPYMDNKSRGYRTEKEMLEEFMKIISEYDPDVITGYNINAFDIPYLLDRLKAHNIGQNFGRCNDKLVFTKTFGIIQECIINGRVAADPYPILKRDPWLRLPRYNLNTVAKHFLGEQKLDIEYREMPALWNGDRKGLEKFVEYARKDADLSLRIVVEKGLLDKFFELSKISGLLLQDTFGGQSTRVETAILHEFKKRNFVMPQKPSKSEMNKRIRERDKAGLKGAIVLEPVKGLHSEGCILVLDFKSLYPSLMRTFNISPDSLINEPIEGKFNESPSGSKFIDVSIRQGILPTILTELIEARTEIKKLAKTAKGDEKRVLTAKQLAIKDMANSFYGYTGYVRARLYMIDVANSITSYGRDNLEKTRRIVEEYFKTQILYADTDSVFLKTNIRDLDEARIMGEQISKKITEGLPGYLELVFEKIYRTFLILSKKRYAGWKFEQSDNKWVDTIEMKGIETVRRDWCPLVSESMNDIINIILKQGDLKLAIERMKDVVKKLNTGGIPIEKLTVIKGITKDPSSYEGTLPHIELARKLTIRNPTDAPKIGDRLGFVIIKGNQMLSKRAEDPKYVVEKSLQIDADYYMNSQLFPPIERIFTAVGISKSEILGGGRQASILEMLNGRTNKPQTENSLMGWENMICKKCNKSFRRPPLSGICECGGELLISYHGNTGSKIVVNYNEPNK